MKRLANITEKVERPICGDEDCCGVLFVAGKVDTVEVDEETEKRLADDVWGLEEWQVVYPRAYGIDTHLSNIGYVEFWDED